ncbi:hypothetical protein E2C06_13770 [Dankookia rubra]|uniref:Uncharacterized protein n=1 Tax=Dankookia rubra TaxID=1442381 RepID=A0A4R5QFJ8_9PROT|nr:hypothetical protein [Dankookia rubra]TDH62032.1 hypothetical protein E2C06_13770 [Dankookia rubra]
MRLPILALLGLMLATGPALATAPSHHPARSAAPAKAPPGPAAPAKARPGLAKAPQARLQQAAWRPGAAPAACSRKARQCRGAGLAPVRFGWTQGLPPAALVQTSGCPDGTMATLARGHDDVVRCMPI